MPDHEEHRSPEEIRQRMEDVIKRAKNAPPNAHADVDTGGKAGKGHKVAAPKARNFRHQGR
jgi:hypothetical protein